MLDQKTIEKQKYGTRMFFLGLEIVGYFAVPAILGVFVGKFVEKKYEIDITIPLLFVTYIISWSIVAIRYRMIQKQLRKAKELDSQPKDI